MPKGIAFVSGDFNVLHPGHLRLLRFASERAERLIVGVISKSTAARADLFEDAVRLQAVKHVDIVDEAILLEEDIATVVARLRPDVVVKGREHRTRFNPEEDALAAFGGRLLFAPGDSTMDLYDVEQSHPSLLKSARDARLDEFAERRDISMSRLVEIIRDFQSVKIWVGGDLIVDDYIDCEPLGMSREDASIAVAPIRSRRFTGGAGVVSAHVAGLGARARLCSVIGDDEAGRFVRGDLSARGVEAILFVDSDRPTTLKERYRANDATLLRVNRLSRLSISEETQQEFLSDLQAWSSEGDGLASGVLFADFNYGCLPQRLVESVSAIARQYKSLLAADSQTSSQLGDIGRFVDVDLITPTEHEARVAMRNVDDGLVTLADALQQRTGAKNIIMTLGDQGALLHVPRSRVGDFDTDRIPALASQPVDPAGAGDSLFATVTVALCAGANIWEAAYLGSLAAAIQVSRSGNIPIQRDELLELLD